MRLVALQGERAGWFAWEGSLPTGFEPKLPGTDADPVLIVYTSGTTGKPKGAVHTQAGLLWNIVNATLYQDLTGSDHVLTALPMFHVGGLCIQTLPALHAGATVTIDGSPARRRSTGRRLGLLRGEPSRWSTAHRARSRKPRW